MEFLVSLCEAREQSPGMMRKLPNLARMLFELVMGFLLDIEVRAVATTATCRAGGMPAMQVLRWSSGAI